MNLWRQHGSTHRTKCIDSYSVCTKQKKKKSPKPNQTQQKRFSKKGARCLHQRLMLERGQKGWVHPYPVRSPTKEQLFQKVRHFGGGWCSLSSHVHHGSSEEPDTAQRNQVSKGLWLPYRFGWKPGTPAEWQGGSNTSEQQSHVHSKISNYWHKAVWTHILTLCAMHPSIYSNTINNLS